MISLALDAAAGTWFVTGVPLFGLASAWLARLSLGSSRQVVCQRLFLLCMMVVGASTALTLTAAAGPWLSSAGTLGVMVISAVCDFRHPDEMVAAGI